MVSDDRFYAFIISYTSRSRSQIRRVCLHKKWLKLSAAFVFVVLCGALYGFYGLAREATHLRIERENQRLRAENEKQRQVLNELNTRVEAVEDTSRKLAEKSGVVSNDDKTLHGAGGPAIPLNVGGLAALEKKMSHLEQDMRAALNGDAVAAGEAKFGAIATAAYAPAKDASTDPEPYQPYQPNPVPTLV